MKTRTAQDYGRRIAHVVDAMARDPAAPHSVESLAAVAHFSPFHFHRLYRAMTGESVAVTLRRLRLSRSARQLARQASVTEAALDAGYETPQSFARAFRALTGLSPTAFRASHESFAAGIPAVTIVRRRPTSLVGLQHSGPAPTIPHTHARLRRWAEAQGLAWSASVRIGAASGDPWHSDGFVYRAGLVVPDECVAGDGLLSYTVAGGRYAVHRLVGPYAMVGPTVQSLFGLWLPRSGLDLDDRPMLELYHGRHSPAALPVIDLLIPIREAVP